MSQKILHDRRLRDVLVYGSIRWRKSDPKPMQACIHGKGGDHSFKFKFFPKKERKHEEAYPKEWSPRGSFKKSRDLQALHQIEEG